MGHPFMGALLGEPGGGDPLSGAQEGSGNEHLFLSGLSWATWSGLHCWGL